jgi:uncharacterized membrane protein
MAMVAMLADAYLTQVQTQTLYWGGVIMVVAIVGFIAIMIFKRLWKRSEAQPTHEAGFSLADLRAMRDRGEITPEEYEQTRANVIAKVKKMPGGKPKPKPKEPPPDLTE